MVRIAGQLCPLEHPPLTADIVRDSVAALGRAAGMTVEPPQVDFSCDVPGAGRFRAHAYWERGNPAIVLRHIPTEIPDFAALRLPPVVKPIASSERGLVLVCGATGNGKSTTIAAMLQWINQRATKHVVTIEDPIEFVFENDRSTFSQREVGRDVDSMQTGMEGALREDPDIVFIGEIRTATHFDAALSAAESGRVVISTFHSSDAMRAVQRMIHMYPQDFREGACHRIADALAAIVCQRLVPMRGGSQRVLVTEVLVRNPTVQDCIRDPARLRALPAALERGTSEFGTHTFDQELLRMIRDGLVSVDTAKAVANSPSDLVRALKLTR
jgi:twitching motility protein PilT